MITLVGVMTIALVIGVELIAQWRDRRRALDKQLDVAREMEGDATIMAVGGAAGRESRERRKE